MVDSTISCLMELQEDPKTSTYAWFNDRTRVLKELMGED